jgi:hypothetical protein
MFADPQSVTVNAVAKSLPRTSAGDHRGVFEDPADGLVLTISHQTGKRHRTTARLDHSKISTDPLVPTSNRPYSLSAYLVFDTPLQGYTTTELGYYLKAMSDWLAVAGNQTKILGYES